MWKEFKYQGHAYRTNADATIVGYWCPMLRVWVRSVSPGAWWAARKVLL